MDTHKAFMRRRSTVPIAVAATVILMASLGVVAGSATAKAARSRYGLKPRPAIKVKNREQEIMLWEVDWQKASGSISV